MTTVMVVDDHRLVRAALVMLLEATPDLRVAAVAADGLEAVALAATAHPDVVLMDLSMPKLDGIQATQQILQLLPRTQIVLLTSSQDQHRIEEALAFGAVSTLVKGRDVTAVLETVRKIGSSPQV